MKAILACDPRGGIGYKNKLPWPRLDRDLVRFKYLTQDQVVVMGKNTWESLPVKPLPNRLNLVVTSHDIDLPNGTLAIKSVDHFKHFKAAWLIGGSNLINGAWDLISHVYLSRTFAEYECDSFIDLNRLEKEFYNIYKTQHFDHTFEIWRRYDNENLP